MKRIDEIEMAIAEQEMSTAQVFTQMKQLVSKSTASPCSGLPWVDAARYPLADVEQGKYTIFAGYEELRLFAIRLRRGDFEYQLGTIDDGGTILDVDGNDTGRQVWDADFYLKIHEPNAIAHPI